MGTDNPIRFAKVLQRDPANLAEIAREARTIWAMTYTAVLASQYTGESHRSPEMTNRLAYEEADRAAAVYRNRWA